ncbi:YpdA family putative bacillithiol disulfide reductase [Hymenobacter sp. BT186]|uniref:YpdA family putative bacillithiol disulfide reductase n=1 Tax=Hymenobacter telluris TaxID=2816474 RepID=A0A939JCX4_9BACT|nr:YpdA family putative bacillithiol disulfide reductase [Hymenobacter telluris]MBO0358303.1 YpdA family putative bacillithiol disulfide reductase [Hymenobacter telluris]MBW3374329.1 YpdA family putative bacillithiol disulfide reductase [Hymenobacter norwichensis]
MVDVVVIGAGPVGLACALEVQRHGLTAVVVDKGALVNSIIGYPTNMEFFSTPELLEIGGHPFPTSSYKPLREDGLDYYRRVAQTENLKLRLYERVTGLEGEAGNYEVVTEKDRIACASVIIATGFYDVPNYLNAPGEDLPHVNHYYKEPYAHVDQDVVVVGAKNSSAKAALQLLRAGARVTMVVRGPEISNSVKYWIRPDLLNRIKEGRIKVHFNATIQRILTDSVKLDTPDGPLTVPADYVYALTGYHPDFSLLAALGITCQTDAAQTPTHDADTLETNRPGVYLAGTVCGGLNTSRWFIENGRYHAQVIAARLAGEAAPTLPEVLQPVQLTPQS